MSRHRAVFVSGGSLSLPTPSVPCKRRFNGLDDENRRHGIVEEVRDNSVPGNLLPLPLTLQESNAGDDDVPGDEIMGDEEVGCNLEGVRRGRYT
ncbi:hypothetical protein BDW62DRAFT_195781 [Aspergillus aurantiobrunneus]